MKAQYIRLNPVLSGRELRKLSSFFQRVCQAINKEQGSGISSVVRHFRQELTAETEGMISDESLKGAFTRSVVLDLVGAGRRIRIMKGTVEIAAPREYSKSPDELKSAVRRSHQLEREDQLRQSSVGEFIRGMERRHLTSTGWHSIFSLMRDGTELAAALRELVQKGKSVERPTRLTELVDPYIQLVTENGTCEHTGLMLRDIWRYFRHTWINSYKPLPGRTMSVLVRDAAAKNHPVIGIAALGSSVAQQRLRDIWVGWDQNTMIDTIRKGCNHKYAKWVLGSLQNLIEGLYLKDLFLDGVCTLDELERPTGEGIEKLEREGDQAMKMHRLYPQAAVHKASRSENRHSDWEAQAQTSLFRSKRCKTLAKLLRIRATFQRYGFVSDSGRELSAAMEKADVRNAIGQLVRFVKAKHVGIDMMDIIVCGAIAPYNVLLGGKLVCMLLCSPEIVTMYRRRYGLQESVIASSMKGAAVVRRPQLVLLGTTSLYGVGSSQYNRVTIPCKRFGARHNQQIAYEKLGQSEGYGSYHFGELTVSLGDTLLSRQKDGRRVNSIFGEGVNPRMRKLREAFDIVGLPADEILQHRNTRIVYAVALARNFSKVLLGLALKAQYLMPQSAPIMRTREIAAYWRERWLLGRIGRPGILEEVGKHNLAYPVTHGARVVMPMEGEE
ncbi:MAG: DUF4338 domain-containing protein [Desulfobacteraceae bacterium]|nr:MAG: DUF4338 domain-containing protein [Desulfobacteraceae bacterium]